MSIGSPYDTGTIILSRKSGKIYNDKVTNKETNMHKIITSPINCLNLASVLSVPSIIFNEVNLALNVSFNGPKIAHVSAIIKAVTATQLSRSVVIPKNLADKDNVKMDENKLTNLRKNKMNVIRLTFLFGMTVPLIPIYTFDRNIPGNRPK